MIQRLSFFFIITIQLCGQAARPANMGLRLIEQELTAVLRWEALWNDLPVSFQIPPNGQARLALNSNAKSLSYCSRDVGVCARYRIDPNRNWEREGSATFDGKHSDEDRLLGFVGESVRKPGINAGSKQLALGGGGLRGLPAASSGMTWTTMISLGQREEIIAQYKQMRPAEIGSLKRWIRASGARNAERATVTIACFAPTDPMVYYFVERAKEAVIMAVFRDRERNNWVVASSLEQSQGPERFDEMRRTIESVACSTMRFE